MINVKLCTKCKKKKSIKEFYKNRTMKNGLGVWCKDCVRKYKKDYKNRPKPIITSKICSNCKIKKSISEFRKRKEMKDGWESNCRECVSRNDRKRNYRLTEKELTKLFNEHPICDICKINFNLLSSKNIHIDHNHKTNKIRGLLCNHCNSLIGMAKENTFILENAIKYLNKYNGN